MTMPGLEDGNLVAAIAGGDRDALGHLYDRHAGALLGLGTRLLGEARLAEDVLHDVFLEVWRGAGSYDPSRGRVKTWLMLRMRSRCFDRLKSAGRRAAVGAEDPSTLVDAGGGSKIEAAADAVRLRAAIGGLPDEQRAVLLLAYFEGLSSTEIAARLEIPVGTVKSRARLGLGTLRSALRDGGQRVT